jgi:8-oxo-dGTP pyrophosphatase MutT (NUDIX family)
MPPIIPAATLVVFRDRPGAAPELLIVERARAMAFAGGALVFPGGRVDPGDIALAETLGGDPVDTAARIAAIRETIEEAGVAIGLDAPLDSAALAALRAALHAGAPLGAALHDAGRTLRLDLLVPFARWLPEGARHRVFDTHFYLARMPDDAPRAIVDGNENVRVFWATARDLLADAEGGRATVIFPTRRNLERLALFAGFDDAAADAAAHPVETITPWIEDRDGVAWLCIPEGRGYPVVSEPLSRAVRA